MAKNFGRNNADAILDASLDDDETEHDEGSVLTLDPTSDRLLKVPEVAKALGVSTGLVYRRVLLDRSFPAIRLGRLLRVRESALAGWIRQCEAGASRR